MFLTYIKIIVSLFHFIAGMRVERKEYGLDRTNPLIGGKAIRYVVNFFGVIAVGWAVYSVGSMIYIMQDNIGTMKSEYTLLKSNLEASDNLKDVYRKRSDLLLNENRKLASDVKVTSDLVMKLDGKYQTLESQLIELQQEYRETLAREVKLQLIIEEDARQRAEFRKNAIAAMMEINKRLDH